MTEGWVPNNDELTQCVLLIQALRDPTRSDHKMALSVSKLSAHHSIIILISYIDACHLAAPDPRTNISAYIYVADLT